MVDLLPYLKSEISCWNKEFSGLDLLNLKRDRSLGIVKVADLNQILNCQYLDKNWMLIDPACTAELQREWENNGFDYQTAREWIKVGLRITDSYYAEWLKKIGLSISEFIDNPFSDLITFFKFVYKGESRRNLATSPIFDGQTWLNNEYLQRKSIVDLIIDRKNLNNSLIIEDLLSLERISAKGNHLNEFVAVNLPKLQKISLTWNPLRNFAIYNCSVLTELDLSSNDLTELNWLSNLNSEILISLNLSDNKFPLQDLSAFSCFTNLEKLCLSSNNFAGSLKHLRFLTRLKNLNISYTKIDCGLEYLSDKIIMIICVRTPFEKQLLLYKNNLQEWQKNRNKKGKFLIKEEDLFSDKRIKELENKLREEKLKNAILQEGFIKLKNFVDELSVSAYNLQEMKLYDNV